MTISDAAFQLFHGFLGSLETNQNALRTPKPVHTMPAFMDVPHCASL